jgi:hypothetical protein
MSVSPKELKTILTKLFKKQNPTITVGSPGSGKTDIHKQVAKSLDMRLITVYPALLDPTDLGGMPLPVAQINGGPPKLQRAYDSLLTRFVKTKRPTLVLFDELGQANSEMQAATAQLILSRRVGIHPVSDTVTFAACTNFVSDLAGANPILTHLISRFATRLELQPTVEDWFEWAIYNEVHPVVISFIRSHPSHLMCSEDQLKKSYATGEAYPCPRAWGKNLADVISAGCDEEEAFHGAVGKASGVAFAAHYRLQAKHQNLADVASGKSELKWPGEKELGLCYLIALGLGVLTNKTNADRIIKLSNEMPVQYAILCLRQAMAVHSTLDIAKIKNSAVGKAILSIRHSKLKQ